MNKSLSALTVITSLCCSASYAGNFSFTLTSPDGTPLEGAVVSLVPTSTGAKAKASSSSASKAVMAQRDKQFAPHIVAVQKGGVVDFPNEDLLSALFHFCFHRFFLD